MKDKINGLKNIWKLVKEYYNSLTPAGKVIFIMVLVLIKMGPDIIFFPILYKYIDRKKLKKLDKASEEFESEIDIIIDDVDFN